MFALLFLEITTELNLLMQKYWLVLETEADFLYSEREFSEKLIVLFKSTTIFPMLERQTGSVFSVPEP